jgi:hypothetical protein
MFYRVPAAILLTLVLTYGFFKAWPLLSGPYFGFSTVAVDSEGFLTIAGRAHHTETFTMNGGTLLIDEHGDFKKVLSTPKGGATLSFTAQDRFGRTRTETKDIMVP